jgi:hypothetical protein
MSYDAPRAASSILGRSAAIARTLDPILKALALSAAGATFKLDPHKLPGRRSDRKGKYFWRAPDAVPKAA